MTRLCLAVAVVFTSLSAWSQESAVSAERRDAPTYTEIERGFYFGADMGFWATINPPASEANKANRYFSPGQAAQVEMGFDFGERVSAAIFFLGASNRMGSDYSGYNDGRTASGDYSSIAPGVSARVRLVGFKDSQDIRRTWISLRLQGAPVFYFPAGLQLPLDVMVAGGLGVEYFTRLRHFSIGLEANFNFMVLTQSFGFSVLPSVRYTF